MKTQQTLITSITVPDRLETPDLDLEKLIDSMEKDGLKKPLLLTGDNLLLDGLRRLEAAKTLGWETVETVNPETLEEVSEAIQAAHDSCPVPTARVAEMYHLLRPLIWGRAVKNRFPGKIKVPARDLMNMAMSRNDVGRIVTLANALREDPHAMRHLWNEVLSGSIGSSLAIKRMLIQERLKKDGGVTSPQDQIHLLTMVARNLSATMTGLKKLEHVTAPAAEVEPLVASLRRDRQQLISAIRRIEAQLKGTKK